MTRPAPRVAPSAHYPGKFDVELHMLDNHSFVAALTHEELLVLEAQIDAVLRPIDEKVILTPGSKRPQVTRKHIGPSHYELHACGMHVATAVKTGENGRDDYPWDWELADDVELIEPTKSRKSGGSEESLRIIVDYVGSNIAQYGLRLK